MQNATTLKARANEELKCNVLHKATTPEHQNNVYSLTNQQIDI